MEHIDALEAVRRLTMERDALANELDAVKDDFRVSRQTLDSIRSETGLHNYGHHLAESLKAMKEGRDALAQQVAYLTIQAANRERLAEQVKRLEVDALQAPERRERHETGTEPTEGTNGEQDALIENPNPIALCCNCRFWRDNERPAPNAETGECRRYPPIINGDYPNQMGDYPNTLGIAWCGEWQAK